MLPLRMSSLSVEIKNETRNVGPFLQEPFDEP